MINKLIYALITIVIVWILFYLGGSFIATSFDPSKWSISTREVIGVFGLLISIVFGAIVAFKDDDF